MNVKGKGVRGGNLVPTTASIFKHVIVKRLKMVKPLSFCFEKLNVTFLDLKVVYLNQLDGDDLQTEFVKQLKEKVDSQEAVVVKASKAVTDDIKNMAKLARQLTVVEAYQPQIKRPFKARALPVSHQIVFQPTVMIEKRKAPSVKLESTPPKRRKLNPKPAPKRRRKSEPASGPDGSDPQPAKRRRKSAPVLGSANVKPLRRSSRKRKSAPTPDPKRKRVTSI